MKKDFYSLWTRVVNTCVRACAYVDGREGDEKKDEGEGFAREEKL